ncbi:hypothetical protein Fmac_024579 [Flemingia macrophylla]|uniref:Uncharacterized protein n=1 Tax=Flemingia macrophylla TaxID=520843 RepID=A0ABD1LPW4_9FABA
MACLVSLSFIVPLRFSPLNKQEVHRHQLDFPLDRLLSRATIRTALKTLGSYTSNNHILSFKGSLHHCMMLRSRFLHETCSYNNLYVDCYHEMVISGYWVGPDPDDGWGFVEAVINQMN